MRTGQVLVTGASGFVGKWTVVELLRAGFTVRAGIRSEDKVETVRQAVIDQLGEDVLYRLGFAKLNLMLDHGWMRAMLRIDAVIHAAGVVLDAEPEHPERIVAPAVEGTERLFRFATLASVRRIVMVSSTAAIGYGHGPHAGQVTFDEDTVTDLVAMRHPSAAIVGHSRAERAAWAYARTEGLALTTLHPGHVLGPALDADVSASLRLVVRLLDGSRPTLPVNGVSVVDVRDVAAMLVAALQQDGAIGGRYLAASDYLTYPEMAFILTTGFPDQPVGITVWPDWRIRLMALFSRPLRGLVHDLGHEKLYARDRAEALLGGPMISGRDALMAAAESQVRIGLAAPPVGAA